MRTSQGNFVSNHAPRLIDAMLAWGTGIENCDGGLRPQRGERGDGSVKWAFRVCLSKSKVLASLFATGDEDAGVLLHGTTRADMARKACEAHGRLKRRLVGSTDMNWSSH